MPAMAEHPESPSQTDDQPAPTQSEDGHGAAIDQASHEAQDPERQGMRHRTGDDETRRFVIEAARQMHDSHCEDIVVLDVRRLSDVTDYIVIASGTSDRQIKSVSDDLAVLAKDYNLARYGSEVDGPSKWLVSDFVDAIVHLFEPVTRAHYDLEMMWGDAPAIHWQRS